jgi:hypothetical protein
MRIGCAVPSLPPGLQERSFEAGSLQPGSLQPGSLQHGTLQVRGPAAPNLQAGTA